MVPEYQQLNAGNQALDGDPDPPMRRGNIEERMVIPLQSIGTLCSYLCENS